MNNIYESRDVFVSGGSRGLGSNLVKQLLELGVNRLYVTARRLRSLDELVELGEGKVIPLCMELTDIESIKAAVYEAKSASIVINNAGDLHFGNVLTMQMEEIKHDMMVNHFGTLQVVRAFYPSLKHLNSPRIVNILSIVSLASKAGIGGYATSKAAAFSATQAIRGTLSKEGVKVHAAFPGGMDTDMLAPVTSEDKDDPAVIAEEILGQVANDVLDIYPGHGKDVGALWKTDPRQLERQFTGA
jgi:NAD(P)-dependent dehydrogenase (short-subunit alcohol dehydrogenase family)